MMYVFVVPFALGGIATAAARGIMSNAVPANAQGELQGATTSLMSLTAIVAPLLMTQLDPSVRHQMPCTFFLQEGQALMALHRAGR